MSTFTWLTPAAPAAVAMVRLPADDHWFARALPAIGQACFTSFIDAAGQPVDEVVVQRIDASWVEVGVHGGPGMRDAVSAVLRAAGLQEEQPIADQWARIAGAPSAAAVRWLLAHDDAAQPPFARAWLERCPQVLITGPVNAGKSTLLNTWCGHRRALATAAAGTTRDLVTAEVEHRGWRLRVIDSAGIRDADNALEQAGIALAQRARAWADVVVVLDPTGTHPVQAGDIAVRSKADLSTLETASLWWSAPAFSSEQLAAQQLQKLGDAVLQQLALPLK